MNTAAHLFTYEGQFVLRCVVYLRVNVVHHLLARHKVPDAVAGKDHPRVLGWVNLEGLNVWLG